MVTRPDPSYREFSSHELLEICPVNASTFRQWLAGGYVGQLPKRGRDSRFTIGQVCHAYLAATLVQAGHSIGSIAQRAETAARAVRAHVLAYEDSIEFENLDVSDRLKGGWAGVEIARQGPEMLDVRFLAFYTDLVDGEEHMRMLADLSALDAFLEDAMVPHISLVDAVSCAALIRKCIDGPMVVFRGEDKSAA